jgi:hypothetical protein
MRARVEFRSAGTISGPLFRGLLTGGGLGNFARFIVILGTVEDANGFSFQFNGKLGNDVLDDVLTIWNLGRAIVLAGVELTLYEDMCSFGESVGHLRNAAPKATTLWHCVFSLHVSFSAFHDFLVATLSLITGMPFGRCFVSAFLPINPMIVS